MRSHEKCAASATFSLDAAYKRRAVFCCLRHVYRSVNGLRQLSLHGAFPSWPDIGARLNELRHLL